MLASETRAVLIYGATSWGGQTALHRVDAEQGEPEVGRHMTRSDACLEFVDLNKQSKLKSYLFQSHSSLVNCVKIGTNTAPIKLILHCQITILRWPVLRR